MGNLGNVEAIGRLVTPNLMTPGTPLWTCTFQPQDLPRDTDYEAYHGTALGPGGFFFVYLDGKFYGAGQNGLFNEYNPVNAMYVRKGQQIDVVWSVGTNTGTFPPVVRFWLRTPSPLAGGPL